MKKIRKEAGKEFDHWVEYRKEQVKIIEDIIDQKSHMNAELALCRMNIKKAHEKIRKLKAVMDQVEGE